MANVLISIPLLVLLYDAPNIGHIKSVDENGEIVSRLNNIISPDEVIQQEFAEEENEEEESPDILPLPHLL